MNQFFDRLSVRSTRGLIKIASLGALIGITAGCAVVPVAPPPPRPYYAAPAYYSYPDYPPYYTYWTGPSVYLNYHDDGFHRGRGYHRGRR